MFENSLKTARKILEVEKGRASGTIWYSISRTLLQDKGESGHSVVSWSRIIAMRLTVGSREKTCRRRKVVKETFWITPQGPPFGRWLWTNFLNIADKALLPSLALPTVLLYIPAALASNTTWSFLPQDLCTDCSLCLENFFPPLLFWASSSLSFHWNVPFWHPTSLSLHQGGSFIPCISNLVGLSQLE